MNILSIALVLSISILSNSSAWAGSKFSTIDSEAKKRLSKLSGKDALQYTTQNGGIQVHLQNEVVHLDVSVQENDSSLEVTFGLNGYLKENEPTSIKRSRLCFSYTVEFNSDPKKNTGTLSRILTRDSDCQLKREKGQGSFFINLADALGTGLGMTRNKVKDGSMIRCPTCSMGSTTSLTNLNIVQSGSSWYERNRYEVDLPPHETKHYNAKKVALKSYKLSTLKSELDHEVKKLSTTGVEASDNHYLKASELIEKHRETFDKGDNLCVFLSWLWDHHGPDYIVLMEVLSPDKTPRLKVSHLFPTEREKHLVKTLGNDGIALFGKSEQKLDTALTQKLYHTVARANSAPGSTMDTSHCAGNHVTMATHPTSSSQHASTLVSMPVAMEDEEEDLPATQTLND